MCTYISLADEKIRFLADVSLTCVIAKSRTVAVRLISMAMTGFYRTLVRPRASRPLSMMKYDPVVKRQVLFLEQKRGGK